MAVIEVRDHVSMWAPFLLHRTPPNVSLSRQQIDEQPFDTMYNIVLIKAAVVDVVSYSCPNSEAHVGEKRETYSPSGEYASHHK